MMKSPAAAVLWEAWRLSRFSLATLMFCSIVGGATLVIAVDTSGERLAFLLAVIVALLLTPEWTMRLRRAGGFPMTAGFARPIATWVLVIAPMVYIAASAAVVFLVPMIMLSAAFSLSFPLLQTAVLIVTARLVLMASRWWTASARIGWLGWIIAYLLTYRRLLDRPSGGNGVSGSWVENLAFSATSYAMMAVVAAGAVGVTVFGVSRQRSGEGGFGVDARAATRAAFTRRFTGISRLTELVAVPCPVRSPLAAQVWYEMRTGAAYVLARGITSVMGFIAVVLIASRMGDELGGYFYANTALTFGLLLPVIAGARSVLGVKRAGGIAYLSSFDAIQPIGTGRLVGLKVAITSIAVLLSWAAMGAAFWVLPTDFMGLGAKPDLDPERLLAASSKIAALLLVLPPFVVTLVAFIGAVHAFFLRNQRAVVIGGQVLAIYLVALIYAVTTGRVTAWAILVQLTIVAILAALATVHLFRQALHERIFGIRGAVAILALGIAAGTGAALDLSPAAGPRGLFILTLGLTVVLPMFAMVLAPWSFARLRHR